MEHIYVCVMFIYLFCICLNLSIDFVWFPLLDVELLRILPLVNVRKLSSNWLKEKKKDLITKNKNIVLAHINLNEYKYNMYFY